MWTGVPIIVVRQAGQGGPRMDTAGEIHTKPIHRVLHMLLLLFAAGCLRTGGSTVMVEQGIAGTWQLNREQYLWHLLKRLLHEQACLTA